MTYPRVAKLILEGHVYRKRIQLNTAKSNKRTKETKIDNND